MIIHDFSREHLMQDIFVWQPAFKLFSLHRLWPLDISQQAWICISTNVWLSKVNRIHYWFHVVVNDWLRVCSLTDLLRRLMFRNHFLWFSKLKLCILSFNVFKNFTILGNEVKIFVIFIGLGASFDKLHSCISSLNATGKNYLIVTTHLLLYPLYYF